MIEKERFDARRAFERTGPREGLLRRSKAAILLNDDIVADGPTSFAQARQPGAEGTGSKRVKCALRIRALLGLHQGPELGGDRRERSRGEN